LRILLSNVIWLITMINLKKINRRRIYLFYLIVLLSAMFWRLANAGDSRKMPDLLSINEQVGETEVTICLHAADRPAVSFSGDDKCLVLDYQKVLTGWALAQKAYASRDLRLGYVTELHGRPGTARVRLYIRQGCLASLRYRGNDVVVRIAEKTSLSANAPITPGVLLSPNEDKYSPAVVSLHDAPLWPVVKELAELAGVEVESSGSLPERFSAELQAASPLDALKELAARLNLELVRRGQNWLISASSPEKPRIYAFSGDLLQ